MRLSRFEVSNYRSFIKLSSVSLGPVSVIVGANNEGKSNLARAINTAVQILESYANHGRMRRKRVNQLRKERDSQKSIIQPSRLQPFHFREYYNPVTDRPKSLKSNSKALTKFCLHFELSDEEIDEFKEKFGSSINSKLQIKISLKFPGKIDPLGRPIFEPEIELVKQGHSKKALQQQLDNIIVYIFSKFSLVMSDAVRPGTESLNSLRGLIESNLRRLQINDENYNAALRTIQEAREGVVKSVEEEFRNTLQNFISDLAELNIEVNDVFSGQTSGISVTIDDGTNTGLIEKGDGVQSLFSLALLQHKAASKRQDQQDMLTVIEEPEAHLNSGAIYGLRKVIEDVSRNQQIIIVTHSPIFVRRESTRHNIVVRNGKAENADSIADIREALGILPAEALENCEAILLVEGETDKTFVVSLIRKEYNQTLHRALSDGRLVINKTKGTKYLDNHINTANLAVSNTFVLTDGDQAARKKLRF